MHGRVTPLIRLNSDQCTLGESSLNHIESVLVLIAPALSVWSMAIKQFLGKNPLAQRDTLDLAHVNFELLTR